MAAATLDGVPDNSLAVTDRACLDEKDAARLGR